MKPHERNVDLRMFCGGAEDFGGQPSFAKAMFVGERGIRGEARGLGGSMDFRSCLSFFRIKTGLAGQKGTNILYVGE